MFIPITVIYIPSFDRPKHPLEAANCSARFCWGRPQNMHKKLHMSEHHRRFFFSDFRISDFGLFSKEIGCRARANPGRKWAENPISLAGGTSLVGGFKHDFYCPFHIWDIIRNPLTFIFFKMVKTINQLPQWSLQAWPQSRCFRTFFFATDGQQVSAEFFP